MEIRKYREMLRHITRPKDKLSFNERKALNEKYLKNGGAVPEAKPMPILDYIKKINSLYSTGGDVEPHTESDDPRYVPPVEMDSIKKELNVSPMVKKEKKPDYIWNVAKGELEDHNKDIREIVGDIYDVTKPKKKIIKKTIITEKPKPTPDNTIIDYLELQDWINTIDPAWMEEKPNEKVLLRVPRRELKGLASLLKLG